MLGMLFFGHHRTKLPVPVFSGVQCVSQARLLDKRSPSVWCFGMGPATMPSSAESVRRALCSQLWALVALPDRTPGMPALITLELVHHTEN